MQRNGSKNSVASWARGFAALWAVLVLTVGLSARPAQAAPFAYVTNYNSTTVSVIDKATNTAVATVGVGGKPIAVAVTPRREPRLSRMRTRLMFQ